MGNSNLKPCPFCGDTVSITYNSFDNVFNVWHDNDKCAFLEPAHIDGEKAKSLTEAYKIWNTRSGE